MKDKKDVIWKDVVKYPGYQISNYGDCRSIKRRVVHKNGHVCWYKGRNLKRKLSTQGYYRYNLCVLGKCKSVAAHRLVGFAFIENTHNKPQINHIDSNRINNYYKNLEWCTHSENQLHSYVMGGRAKIYSGGIHDHRKPVVQKTLDGVKIKVWNSAKDAEQIGFNASAIGKCCKGQKNYNTHLGFKWAFIECV